MAMWQKGANLVSRRLPRVLGSGAHTVVDYSMAALFLGAGILFWRQHKRAALSSLLCGAGALLNSAFTDYPGGAVRAMSFETHGQVDVGLAGMSAALPSLMGFASEPEARFFEAAAVAGTLAAGFTRYHAETAAELEEKRRAA